MHILFMNLLRLFGTYDFSAPVNQPQWVVIDLAYPAATAAAGITTDRPGRSDTDLVKANAPSVESASPPLAIDDSRTPIIPEQQQSRQESQEKPVIGVPAIRRIDPPVTDAGDMSHQPEIGDETLPPTISGSTFLTAQYEKLTFQISMHGIPVGTAELESKYEHGESSIMLRVSSNIATSSIYSVDDFVETRHVSGGFIMTKIIQHEGSFRSDQLFTINPLKKRVTWFDNINGRSLKLTVPTEDVLDSLSAIYYLRNRQLEVGRTETLHVYDSETYADVPVEVLAREEMLLPNFTKVNTIVVRPLQTTAGIFRRTGDVLIWMTDDANKVPVKIVTTIALGRVTVELVSAESKPHE